MAKKFHHGFKRDLCCTIQQFFLDNHPVLERCTRQNRPGMICTCSIMFAAWENIALVYGH